MFWVLCKSYRNVDVAENFCAFLLYVVIGSDCVQYFLTEVRSTKDDV
jgi:hypothetical protein